MFQQGVLHCEICNAELPNFNSMQWHINGKRHKNALQFWKNKQQQAKTSVFVRGFPMGTTEQELWNYFCDFGEVTKVSIVKPQHIYAIVEFKRQDTVRYVLDTENHRLNSQNLIVKLREVKVPGQPASNQYEHGYRQFERGGHLAVNRGRGRGGGMGLLAFGRAGYQETPQPFGNQQRGAWGQNETWFDEGQGQGQGKKRKAVSVEEQIDMYYHEEMVEKLVRVKGVQNQLEWLCQNLQVTADEAQKKFTLCEKLQSTLGNFFPGCTVNQFGSSVNGFGLSGCDMDIFLDLSTMHSRTWEVKPVKLPYVRDFKFLKDKQWGPLLPADLDRMGLGDQCKLISRILTDNMDGIFDAQVIPSSRCPLCRFKYAGTDIKCDLSVNNKMALQNTKLLYLYSVLNSRVRLLVYAIRYWGKIKGIAGNSQASTKMSNYALTLLVLNYLQNVEPPVLPTIETLSNLHGPANRTKIEGWDFTFAMDWQVIPQSSNHQSAAELLSGFFSYWSAFNFKDNVLNTRTGKEVSFVNFYEKDNMSDGRIRGFKAAAMNIQDPFVLNHNLTQNVNEKSRDQIMKEFRIAAIKTSVWGNEGFSLASPSGGGDLIHLLNREVPDIVLQEEAERLESEREKVLMPRKWDHHMFDVEFKPSLLNSKIVKQLQKGGENYRVEWCKKTCTFMTRVLKEILLLNVEELPEATDDIKEKLKEEKEKKEAADRHNKEILRKRGERRAIKYKEAEDKFNAKVEALKKGDGAEDGGEKPEEEGASADQKPPSIFDLHLETPKRFKGDRRYEFSIEDFMEELSDDGEELIDYKPEEPALRYREESDAEVSNQYFMRAWCMTWARRKKVKNYLVNQEGRTEEGIPMEKLISEAIWQNDNAPLGRPVVGFYCYMDSEVTESDCKVVVRMECREGERDFNTFFQFTKMYIYKMIEKYFN